MKQKNTSTTSKKDIAFREITSRLLDSESSCLEAYCNSQFRYWETVTLQGIEREDIAPAKEWVPCNIGGDNISMAWRVYWENNEKHEERSGESTTWVQHEICDAKDSNVHSPLLRLQSFCINWLRILFKRSPRK